MQGLHELITDQVILWRCSLTLSTDILILLRSWQTRKKINSRAIKWGLFVSSSLICISYRLVAMKNYMKTKCYAKERGFFFFNTDQSEIFQIGSSSEFQIFNKSDV